MLYSLFFKQSTTFFVISYFFNHLFRAKAVCYRLDLSIRHFFLLLMIFRVSLSYFFLWLQFLINRKCYLYKRLLSYAQPWISYCFLLKKKLCFAIPVQYIQILFFILSLIRKISVKMLIIPSFNLLIILS